MSEPPSPSPYQRSESRRLEVVGLGFLDNGPYSFSLSPGECLGMSGPSGVGKTQLLRAVVDLIPHTGEVFCDGVEAGTMAATVWRRKVGLIPADPVWWFDRVGAHLPAAAGTTSLEEYLALLGLPEDVVDWQVGRLSTGERQRLGLLRGLLLEPAVLLLDEPTSGLDRPRAGEVEKLISRYRQESKGSVVWVSHDPEQLGRVSDRIVQVEKKQLTKVG